MKISIRATQILVVTTIACQVGCAKAQCVNKITDFALIDATNDQFIRKLPETLNVREYKDIELNFRAKFESCPSNPIQSVLFIFAPIIGGKEDFSQAIATCDRFAPYTLMGDSGDVLNQDLPRRKADYNGVSLNPPPNDSYVLRAHPFSGPFCNVNQGEELVRTITLSTGTECVGDVSQLVLYSAESNVKVAALQNGMNICSSDSFKFDIKADTNPCENGQEVQSVLFDLRNKSDSGSVLQARRNDGPFFFGGYNVESGDVSGVQFEPGDYVLEVTPYSDVNLGGSEGKSLSIGFTFRICGSGPTTALPPNPPTPPPQQMPTNRPSNTPLIPSPSPSRATKSQPLPTPAAPADIVPRFCSEDSGYESPGYQICMDLKISSLDVAVFIEASQTWSQKITGDLPKVDTSGFDKSFACRNYPKEIDDLYICGQYEDIDGELGVLGRAGPTYLRRDGSLPATGQMIFDSADMSRMRAEGSLKSVILHEIGHIVGIGTLWEILGVAGKASEGCPYLAANANREWRAISGCSSAVPTEQQGGSGTRCGHWDETCLRNELMTGLVSRDPPPFSRITIGSLADMGYQVDYSKADSFSKADLNPDCVCNRRNMRGKSPFEPFAAIDSKLEFNRQRRLSKYGQEAAEAYGKKHLQRMKEIKKNMTENDQVIFVGDKFVSVLYVEDNYIYRVDVG